MSDAISAPPIAVSPAPVEGAAVLCPLCAYDLRGLVEPRCPECGYRFVWEELLDRRLNEHPYLFEHHPRRNVWSFFRTAIGGQRPLLFWRTLRPQMPVKRRRLVAYWLICTALPAFLGVALLLAITIVDALFSQRVIAMPMAMPPLRPVFADRLDQLSFVAIPFVIGSVCVFAWTIVTFLTLLIFQDSMAKAKIRRSHVERCIAYSYDIGFWFAVPAPVVFLAAFYDFDAIGTSLAACFGLYFLALLLFAATKLWMAYRLYLGFDHSFWVVLSSQIITFLALAVVVLNLGQLR